MALFTSPTTRMGTPVYRHSLPPNNRKPRGKREQLDFVASQMRQKYAHKNLSYEHRYRPPKKKCLVGGCLSYETAIGLCGKHYQQWRSETEPRCVYCGGQYLCRHRNPELFAESRVTA